jgi:P27 family predicted phage terminase small subunit
MRGTKPQLVVDNGAISRDHKAPAWMSRDAKAEWKRVFPVLRERRILTVADLGALENYCLALGQVREMERTLQAEGHVITSDKGPKKHPAVAVQADAMNRSRLLAAELGLTPVSRSRPAVRKDENEADISPLDF